MPVTMSGAGYLYGLACASTTDCIAVGYNSSVGVASYSTDGGQTWSTLVAHSDTNTLSCVRLPHRGVPPLEGGRRRAGRRHRNRCWHAGVPKGP